MKITTFIYSLIFLCAGMCCPPDIDREYKNFEIEAPGLIEIQNEGDAFDQNDTLWVKSLIPNTLTDKTGEQIDINELTGNSGTAYLGLNLFLKSNFTQASPINLSETCYSTRKWNWSLS